MKLFTALLTALSIHAAVVSPSLAGGGPDVWSLIRVRVADAGALRALWEAGLDPEGSSGKPGGWMEFVAGPAERRALAERGVAFDVVTPDLAAEAGAGLARGPFDAMGFGAGSMGGYYTLDEVGSQLDSMRLLHPGLISEKQAIGYSLDGRPVWAVRISDHPDDDEPGEPEVLYTALHHAREPAGMMTVVYYMWWLLEQYGADPRATYIIDNRQVWFIPVVNPDGYRYNQTTNPSGGGMWRKNRRVNGDGSRGIDLNRNYGPYEMWNAPNGGSSSTPASDTYRGTAPFSEPETQTIDTFMRLHGIRTCLNYHTYSRMLVYPWGCYEAEGPDSLIFREYAFDLTRVNRYVYGTDLQTVNYSTRGNSDDYMYGDSTKFRTFAMTPEVGTSFWPPSGQILPLAIENLEANISTSMFAGAMPVAHDLVPSSSGPDSAGLLPGSPFSFTLTIRNRGLDTSRGLVVSLESATGALDVAAVPHTVARLSPRSDTTIVVSGTVDSTAVPGARIPLSVRLTDTAGYDRSDTLFVFTGKPHPVFSDGGEEGVDRWITEGAWGLSPAAHGGSFSLHDSPTGGSPPWTTAGIETAAPLNLAGFTAARLEYWTKWEIEPSYDFAQVKVSTDSGASWAVLRSALSNPASGSGAQTAGTFGYDGYTPGLDWVRQEIDLSAYAGAKILLRFELDTDGSDSRDGWYVDDIRVTGFRAPVPGGAVTVSSAGSSTVQLRFGEWPGAGPGIDPWIGESELAAPPTPGAFDARWVIPGTAGAGEDVRDILGGTPDTNVFTISISATPADYPVAIRWTRDELTSGSWKLDGRPGTPGAAAADMWRTDGIVLTDPSDSAVRIVHAMAAGIEVRVPGRWGLVSLPVDPPDRSVPALFPSAAPQAYSYAGGYDADDSLSPGAGYWLLNSGAGSTLLAGVPVDRNEVSNSPGSWTLFGAIYCPLLRSEICPSCDSPPLVYGYRNGYYVPDTLVPGEAYWYHGTGPLVLDCRTSGAASGGGAAAPRSGAVGPATPEPPPAPGKLTFASPRGSSAAVWFGPADPGNPSGERFRLPPVPPAGAFDVRFETENAVEYFTEGGVPVGIRISADADSLTALYSGARSNDGRFLLELADREGGVRTLPLSDGATIAFPSSIGIRIVPAGPAAAPGEFRLHGNYPNPFNPSTTISFDLPWPARVSLAVTNAAGQNVAAAGRTADFPAGRQAIGLDASGLSSGVYFYTLRAEGADGTAGGGLHGRFIVIR